MIAIAGIAPQIGAAIVAGVFAMINTALTLYIIRGRNDAERRTERQVIDVERGGVPEPEKEMPNE